MSALDEKSRAERALKDLQRVQGEQQVRFQMWLSVSKCHLLTFSFFWVSVCVPFRYFRLFNFTVFRFHINVFCHLLLSANLDLNGMYPHGQSVYFVVVRNRFFLVLMSQLIQKKVR